MGEPERPRSMGETAMVVDLSATGAEAVEAFLLENSFSSLSMPFAMAVTNSRGVSGSSMLAR